MSTNSSPLDLPEASLLWQRVPFAWLRNPLLWLWVSPGTLLGLVAGGLTLLSGGRMFRYRHTLEVCGGFAAWYLQRIARAQAMTLGHVILGRTQADLDRTRYHEWVHVRQYERWGPLFVPAYLLSSCWLWLRGRNCYLDNPFEVEAFAAEEEHRRQSLVAAPTGTSGRKN